MTNMKPSTITEYFEGQSIFVTGSTGALGKVLIEMLLRCCPGVARIYLLIREKKNVPIEERWKKITELPLYDKLKETNPKAFDKVTLVSGDIRQEEMGLSEADKQCLLENVTIIYHVAAMIQFTDGMVLALISNTKATHTLLEFARRMKNLQLFHHVSTAFCNMNVPCDKAIEEVIPGALDWKVILKILDTQPAILDTLKEKLLNGHPNPYTWSKWLAEQIVNDYRIHFPTVISRPATVASTFRDPFPGWIESLVSVPVYALTNAVAFGLVRVIYSSKDCYVDYIPADATIKAMLVASWKKCIEPAPERTDVYNCCLMKDFPIYVSDYMKYGKIVIERFPSKSIIWPSRIILTTNEFLYKTFSILLHVLPAALIDFFCLIQNKERKAMKMTIKLTNMLRMYKNFSSRKLGFPNDKYKALNDDIPEGEWDTYNTVFEGLDAERIIDKGYQSILKYFLKERTDEETAIRNKRRYKWLVIIDETMIFCFYIAGVYLLYNLLSKTMIKLL